MLPAALFAGTATAEASPDPSPIRISVGDLSCPEGTFLEQADSPDGDHTAVWCQIERDGQVARHGPYLELDADGTVLRRGLYRGGLQFGRWTRFDPSGEVLTDRVIFPGEAGPHVPQPEDLCPPGSFRDRSRSTSKETRLRSTCLVSSEEGEEIQVGPEVIWIEIRRERGPRYALREIGHYADGRRQGVRRLFDGPSRHERLVGEIRYEDDVAVGESRSYYLDGSLREIRHFADGRLHGERVAYYPDGSERWRAIYEEGRRLSADGDLTVAGLECPGGAVPTTSPDGLEDFCQKGVERPGRDGPFVRRDESGRIVESGRYRWNRKVEIWDAPAGVERPVEVPDDVLVAEAHLVVGHEPFLPTLSEEAWQERHQPQPIPPSQFGVEEDEADSSASSEAKEPPLPADIWFRDLRTRQTPSSRTEVEDGVVRIYGMRPGRYYMQVRIDAVTSNPEMHPGDLMASAEFEVREGEIIRFEVPLLYTLHLVEPWDNAELRPELGSRCETYPATESPVTFAWEPPPVDDPRGIEYVYQVWRRYCEPNGTNELLAKDVTTDTSVVLELPPTPRTHYDYFVVHARRDGRQLGQIMTFFEEGSYGWRLIFRVGR